MKKKLEEKLNDWKEIKEIVEEIRRMGSNPKRIDYVNALYIRVRDYFNKYHERFNINNKPGGQNGKSN